MMVRGNGSVNFGRSINTGFGHIDNEFWAGKDAAVL